MRNLSCIIVDDEPLAVKLLETFVNKTPGLELTASFTDSVEAVQVINIATTSAPAIIGREQNHQWICGSSFEVSFYWR